MSATAPVDRNTTPTRASQPDDICSFYASVTGCDPTPPSDPTLMYCEVCQMNVPKEDHNASAIHQFSTRLQLQPPHFYGITEDNKGYRMMVENLGWDEEHGLGANEQGPLDPVPTALKLDRAGLGATRLPLRVTHTNVNAMVDKMRQERRRKQNPQTRKHMTQAQRRRIEKLERSCEEELRRYLHSDSMYVFL